MKDFKLIILLKLKESSEIKRIKHTLYLLLKKKLFLVNIFSFNIFLKKTFKL